MKPEKMSLLEMVELFIKATGWTMYGLGLGTAIICNALGVHLGWLTIGVLVSCAVSGYYGIKILKNV